MFYKFVEQVGQIFNNLPKPGQWLSFYLHDLPLLLDFCEEVREPSIEYYPFIKKAVDQIIAQGARRCIDRVGGFVSEKR